MRSTAAACVALLACACDPGVSERHPMPGASAARGLAAIERVGCGACHVIPGVDWPQGRVGPSLAGFAAQPFIAGGVPNEPERLTAFVRNATAYAPEAGMPPMPLSEQEARDVAAYLYTLRP